MSSKHLLKSLFCLFVCCFNTQSSLFLLLNNWLKINGMYLRYKIQEDLTYVHTHLWKNYPDQGRKCPSLPKVSSQLLCHACAPTSLLHPTSLHQATAGPLFYCCRLLCIFLSFIYMELYTPYFCQLLPVSIIILQFIRVVVCVSSSLLTVRLNHFLNSNIADCF